MFTLTEDKAGALRSHSATLKPAARLHRAWCAGRHHPELPRVVEVSIYVVRAFVQLREEASTHTDFAKRLGELEHKTEALAMNHDTFSRNTRVQLKQVFDALRELMTPPDPPKRPVGFIAPEDKRKKTSVARGKT
jgi:hypothetical protein